MNEWIIAFLIFGIGYFINIFYVTVFYHRGLAHQSVQLRPFIVKWVGWTGNWITGIDPKAWACMHRLHHEHSDTERDPHSPVHQGVFGVAMGQLKSYQKVLRRLIKKDKVFSKLVADIPFNVHFLNRSRLWILPYIIHVVVGVLLGIFFHSWIIGIAYYLGIMSHPIQGWMVNALAHRFGYRNFSIKDHSRNNFFVSLLVFGEGYQNNHHAFPSSPKFSKRFFEFDLGYVLCLMGKWTGLLRIPNTRH